MFYLKDFKILVSLFFFYFIGLCIFFDLSNLFFKNFGFFSSSSNPIPYALLINEAIVDEMFLLPFDSFILWLISALLYTEVIEDITLYTQLEYLLYLQSCGELDFSLRV